MKRSIVAVLLVLLASSASYAIRITSFVDTKLYAARAADIVIATCNDVPADVDEGDGLHPVDVTVISALKGKSAIGKMKIVTIYAMEPGKRYLLYSLGGKMGDITLFAVPELSVVEISPTFDLSSLNGKPLVDQINSVFAARRSELEREISAMQSEAKLLGEASTKPQ